MNIVDMKVVKIEDGWVHFGDPTTSEIQFKRTVETHQMMTGKEAKCNDVYKFELHYSIHGNSYYFSPKSNGTRG